MSIKKEFKKFMDLNNEHNLELLDVFYDYIDDDTTIEELKGGVYLDLAHEMSDSQVDIYNGALIEWCKWNSNVEHIHEAIDEYGLDVKNFNFYDLIKMGQYHYYYNQFIDICDDFIDFLDN